VLFAIDAEAHETAVREAKRLAIPIIAIMNNDNDPADIAYPIPANDNTRSSLAWIFERIEKSL
jgi:small subunit ribosomal protein S2